VTLAGQIALVTGAAGRLGPIWAAALRREGAKVALVDKSNIWNECGGTIAANSFGLYANVDVSDQAQVKALREKVEMDMGGPVSILVNNAGIDSRPSTPDAYEAMAADMVRVNILGTDLMIREFAPHMPEGGSIINIASLYGLVAPDLRYYDHRSDGWVKDPMYGATKAAGISLTRYYAAALAPKIRVNALAPGGVVAPGDALTAQDPQFMNKYTSRIPMQRMCRPDDLGGPLVFLASSASSFLTGQTLALDGGYLCW
jgi:NAD(P)-dependent dehydrogenase (short-subunit alcohol dehydrogenase family)